MNNLPKWIKTKLGHLKDFCHRNLDQLLEFDLDPSDYDFMEDIKKIESVYKFQENREISQPINRSPSRLARASYQENKEKSEEIKKVDRDLAGNEMNQISLTSKVKDETSTQFQPTRSTMGLISMCCICNKTKAQVAFLCNHNYCEKCLAEICCNQILSYCTQLNQSEIKKLKKFEYHCQAANCRATIQVPTRKVVKYILDTQLKNDVQGFKEYFEQILEYNIAFFDGIYY